MSLYHCEPRMNHGPGPVRESQRERKSEFWNTSGGLFGTQPSYYQRLKDYPCHSVLRRLSTRCLGVGPSPSRPYGTLDHWGPRRHGGRVRRGHSGWSPRAGPSSTRGGDLWAPTDTRLSVRVDDGISAGGPRGPSSHSPLRRPEVGRGSASDH